MLHFTKRLNNEEVGRNKRMYCNAIWCIEYNNYRKFRYPKIYIFNETLAFFIICDKCDNSDRKKNILEY